MAAAETYCRNCESNTEVIFDHSDGMTVCSQCGSVLDLPLAGETSQWTSRKSNSGDTGAPNGYSEADFPASRNSDPDRSVPSAFKSIGHLCDRLSLKSSIKDRALEMFRSLEEKKCIRGRRIDALAAACVYMACRQEGKPRTVKEISSSTNGAATKKEIGRAKEFITKQLKVEMGESMEMGTIQAGDYLLRFCLNLGASEDELKAVQETVGKTEEFDIRRCPISIAAAIIFMITQLSDSKRPSLRQIAAATTVSEGTIRNAYRDLFPLAEKILPEWFVEKKDLSSLSSRD